MPLRTLLIAATACWLLPTTAAAAAESPDFEGVTAAGLSVRVFSELQPLQINRIHSWLIEISDRRGQPFRAAQVQVTGGMPDHDHGLPTFPLVTGEPTPGRYRLEGVRFHMPGRWQIMISIDGDDPLTLDFEL